MRSLEIVNERIEYLEDKLKSANYLVNDNPSEFGKQVIEDLNKHLGYCKQIKQDLEFLKVLIEHLAIVEEQFDVDEVVNILVLNDIDEITNFKIYKKALEYINKYGVKNVGS